MGSKFTKNKEGNERLMYQQDWVMRQIEMTIRFVAETVFRRDSVQYEIKEDEKLSPTDLLHRRVVELLSARRLWDAEHLMLESLDKEKTDDLLLAVEFYQSLNAMSDEDLQARGFSRDDIMDGLSAVLHQFGITFPEL